MKNHVKLFAVMVAAFAVGFGVNNFATGDVPSRIAVVDVNTVVAKSSEVQALKKEQETKMQELQTWLNTVRADVAKQQTQEGKEKLVKKYDAEFAKKQEAIKENYAKKLKAIDKSISSVIAQEAKNQNYDVVLSKGAVLYGGKDITKDITKLVK